MYVVFAINPPSTDQDFPSESFFFTSAITILFLVVLSIPALYRLIIDYNCVAYPYYAKKIIYLRQQKIMYNARLKNKSHNSLINIIQKLFKVFGETI